MKEIALFNSSGSEKSPTSVFRKPRKPHAQSTKFPSNALYGMHVVDSEEAAKNVRFIQNQVKVTMHNRPKIRRVEWSSTNLLSETFSADEYDRTSEDLPYFSWTSTQQYKLLRELKEHLRTQLPVHPNSPSAIGQPIMPYKEETSVVREWARKMMTVLGRLLLSSKSSTEVVSTNALKRYESKSI